MADCGTKALFVSMHLYIARQQLVQATHVPTNGTRVWQHAGGNRAEQTAAELTPNPWERISFDIVCNNVFTPKKFQDSRDLTNNDSRDLLA